MVGFLRFQSAIPNRSGRCPGVFAMANGLARQGRLSAIDEAWWEAANTCLTKSYVDPSTVAPECYDRTLNPGAAAWFKESSHDQIELTREYLALLDRYGVAWVELRTASPGRIVYEDDVQVVATPYDHDLDWPLHDRPSPSGPCAAGDLVDADPDGPQEPSGNGLTATRPAQVRLSHPRT